MTALWFDELAEFLRIESVSADSARAAEVREAGDWVCSLIREAGGDSHSSSGSGGCTSKWP